MPVRRSGGSSALVAAAALLAACGRAAPATTDAAPSASSTLSASSAPPASAPRGREAGAPTKAGALARAAFARATEALFAAPECSAGAAYGALRRALAAAEPFARPFARQAADVLYGPPRPADEGAGAVGALDAALARGDCTAAKAARFQISTALGHGGRELLDSQRLSDAYAAQALSDAAYELGLAVLQARTSSSNFDEADRGEVLGLVDAIEAGARALFAEPMGEAARALDELRAVRDAVEQAPTMGAVSGRAQLARRTGMLGLSLRNSAREHGHSVRPPYRSPEVTEDAAVSALSLPPPRIRIDPELAALGKRLFSDVRLSAGGRRSCASCHDAARAFSEPRATPTSLDPSVVLRRNTPTLLYNGMQATQLWDGRILTAEAQALRVVHNRGELGLDDAELVASVRSDPAYEAAFSARAEKAVTPKGIAAALGAYVASLGAGSAPIDAYARGDDAALSPEALRGLDVFVGSGRCARCHVPPLWGGSRPRDFAVAVYAVVGVPASPGAPALDADLGRFEVTKLESDKGSFKAPTVRNITRTAPYMHHGRFATLEQVIDLYDRGGGRGFGLAVPNQDPDVRPLRLSPEARRALIAFLQSGLLDKP